MRLKIVSCVTAAAALCLMALPASAGGWKNRGACCGTAYTYTYAYPAYTYAYVTAPGYYYRPYRRHWRGARVRAVPAYSYGYVSAPYTYAYPGYGWCR